MHEALPQKDATHLKHGGMKPPKTKTVALPVSPPAVIAPAAILSALSPRTQGPCRPRQLEHGGSPAESLLTAEPSCKDEARIGQKNKITRRWARRGTRPSAPHDQRTRSAYIFGAVCPAQGSAAGLVLPRCNTAAMALHLAEISRTVTPGAHAVLLLDQAGWHLSGKLDIPDNITLMPLPPKSPELNPVENIWQFIRDNWLSNRVFRSYEDILEHCCHAWNKLVDQPWTIMSIGLRDWAHGF
jgi:transposase